MTPTLNGRLQTRVFLTGVVGLLWTLLLTPALPVPGPLRPRYAASLTVLAIVLALGLIWELAYHAAQQFRWEKDWPILLSLLLGAPEAVLVWLVLSSGVAPQAAHVPLDAFIVHFTSTWFVTWLVAVGPMRVLFLRWRFTGGRLI